MKLELQHWSLKMFCWFRSPFDVEAEAAMRRAILAEQNRRAPVETVVAYKDKRGYLHKTVKAAMVSDLIYLLPRHFKTVTYAGTEANCFEYVLRDILTDETLKTKLRE